MGTHIGILVKNVSMYVRNACFQFMSTIFSDSGFVTTDGEFGIWIIFMQSLSPRIPAVLHRKEIVWGRKAWYPLYTTIQKALFLVKDLFSRSFNVHVQH